MAEKSMKTETKQNILMAASECFAHNGYKDTTIRDIATAAGANVAAINYYFGDKEQLYLAVMRYWVNDAFKDQPFRSVADTSLPPEERLKSFIRAALLCMIGENGKGTGFGRLITLEAAFFPTEMIQQILSESIGTPTHTMMEMVRELLGPAATEEKVYSYSASIVGQTAFFYTSRFLNELLFHLESPQNVQDLEQIADNIFQFSMNAIQMERNRAQ